MQVQFIEIGGERRPAYWGMLAMDKFCKATGKKFLEIDLPAFSPLDYIHMAYAMLEDGARKQKVDFTATLEDLEGWLDEDLTLIVKFIEVYGAAQALPDNKKKQDPAVTE